MHRVSPLRSEATARHSKDAEAAQADMQRAPSAKYAGSDKSAPSVSQKDLGQGCRRSKRSYAGELTSKFLHSAFPRQSAAKRN